MTSGRVIEPLSDEKIAALKEVFSTFDDKGDNHVQSKNVRSILQGLGYDLSEMEVKCLLTEHTGMTGETSFEEMCTILSYHAADFDQMTSARILLNLLDKDRKGFVNAKDIQDLCGILNVEIEAEQAEQMVRSTSLYGYDTFTVMDMHAFLMYK